MALASLLKCPAGVNGTINAVINQIAKANVGTPCTMGEDGWSGSTVDNCGFNKKLGYNTTALSEKT